jgi:hypothetical protein
MFSTDPLFDNFAMSIGLGLGGQPGEILAACAGIADSDDRGWYDAWSATADRLTAEADRSLARRPPQRDCSRHLSASQPLVRNRIPPSFSVRPSTRGYSAPSSGSPRRSSKPLGSLDPPGERWIFRTRTPPCEVGSFERMRRAAPTLLIATNGYDATLYRCAIRALCETYRELDHDAEIHRADIAANGELTVPVLFSGGSAQTLATNHCPTPAIGSPRRIPTISVAYSSSSTAQPEPQSSVGPTSD